MKYLLSIDGGGAKGRMVAQILYNIEKHFGFKLIDKFDFFAGTSIGAVIVTAITAKELSGEQIYDLFTHDNLSRVFSKGFTNYLPFTSKYSGDGKLNFLQEIFEDIKFNRCFKRTLIPVYDIRCSEAETFDSRTNKNLTCATVLDATTAAPTYFPTKKIGKFNLVDGGVVANNPSMILLSNVLSDNVDLHNIKLLSIGCGTERSEGNSQAHDWGVMQWLKEGIIDDFMVGNMDIAHDQANVLLKNNYLRINFPLGNVSPELDNIKEENLIAMDKKADLVFDLNINFLEGFFK